MFSTRIVIISLLIYLADFVISQQNDDLTEWFEKINTAITKYNRIAAETAWEASVNPGNPGVIEIANKYQKQRIQWQHQTCNKLLALKKSDILLNKTQTRQTYLLCRGPIYKYDEARETSYLYEEVLSIYYDGKICIPLTKRISKDNVTEVEEAILKYIMSAQIYLKSIKKRLDPVDFAAKVAPSDWEYNNHTFCIKGESDFDKLMSMSRNEMVLRWLWLVWRENVGPTMKQPFKQLVEIENVAARRNGYSDIGETWRDELETPNLGEYCRKLFKDIQPLYTLLHGVVRFYLRKQYGDVVPEKGPIPAHLLGNLWAQNWEPLADLIAPSDLNIDKSITKMNWTVTHMVKRAEDFYQSFGLPPMTKTFWRESVFAKKSNDSTRCHGTAADMFTCDDYRLLYCAGTSSEDFYVLHHEMGHIQYYMAYKSQPGLFRQGANSAFHESIGDAIMYGVTTPQHLYRLGLINDSILYSSPIINHHETINNEIDWEGEIPDEILMTKGIKVVDEVDNTIDEDEDFILKENIDTEFSPDDILLLKQALNKIPQIPFALLIDEYRWKYFEGGIEEGSHNRVFWDMALELQGIAPHGDRGEDYFDIGAKFHVPDNTPYIRYFLSSFLQHQLFEALCKAAVFGRRDVQDEFIATIPLNRCDIYGSKAVGNILRDLMSRGSSQHWRDILYAATGKHDISSSSLKRYYNPLYKLLSRLVVAHQIPLGWYGDQEEEEEPILVLPPHEKICHDE